MSASSRSRGRQMVGATWTVLPDRSRKQTTARALNPSKPPLSATKIDRRRANNRLGANRRWIGDGFDGRTMNRDANREKEK